MAELKIREAVAADLPFLLENVARIAEYGETAWRDRASMIATDSKVMEQETLAPALGSIIFVAENEQGVPLGFIHLTTETDYYSQRAQAHVGDLAVARQGEGQGIGAALLQAGEDWARSHGFELLNLNVFVQNTRAQKLYERMGFVADTLRYVKPITKQE